jgi:uracil-DNA glycosylase
MSQLPWTLEPSWQKVLADELQKPYISQLEQFVEQQRRLGLPVYPPAELTFSAFQKAPFNRVRVCIVGQDPYHGPGQAHGLCFSVQKGIPFPPSLRNIFKELSDDLGISPPKHGCLDRWAEQGVLLLNATLTVTDGRPKSHYGKGWEQFTDAVIQCLARRKEPVVFVLWGSSAQEKWRHVVGAAQGQHLVLRAAHPSPLSAYNGFFGCGHFSKINRFLAQHGSPPIDWEL